MGEAKSTSTTSSNGKRKRTPAMGFYAVKSGHRPDIYYSWDDAKAQVTAFKNPVYKKFSTLADAEAFMKSPSTSTAKPGKAKYYGVQVGHNPGVYTEYSQVLQQVTKYPGSKQKSFATLEEAQAFVDEGAKPISLNGNLESATPSVADTTSQKSSKKQKKNNGSAAVPTHTSEYEPGMGPLPPDAEDGFDRTIKLNAVTGAIENKSEAELNAHKLQATGEFEGALKIYTDGSSLGNGKIGAFAGIGVHFGYGDPRNVSAGLAGDKQTNQRAELTALARALDIAPIDRDVIVYTDSKYAIQCNTEWFQKWERNSWKNSTGKAVENRDIIEPTIDRIREREMCGAKTKLVWIRGHSNIPGNIAADALAVNGAREAQARARLSNGHRSPPDEPPEPVET